MFKDLFLSGTMTVFTSWALVVGGHSPLSTIFSAVVCGVATMYILKCFI